MTSACGMEQQRGGEGKGEGGHDAETRSGEPARAYRSVRVANGYANSITPTVAACGFIRSEKPNASHAQTSRGTVFDSSSPERSTHHSAMSTSPHETESTCPQYAEL